MTLVVVSNRVASGDANEPKIGGLEAALRPVVQQSGAIWVGPSPPLEVGQEKEPPVRELGGGKLVRVDVPAEDHRRYYEGFANSALWPALHSRTDLINASEADHVSYCKISAIMARELLQFKEPTAFWVHDYHFLTLGAELRKLGIKQPIGFFLHTPWPAPEVMLLVPHQCELVESMLAYDLIGFQTDDDRKNFLACVRADLELTVSGDGVVLSPSRGVTRCQVFPIGIDVDTFALWSAVAASEPWISGIRRGLNSEKIAIGVDRIDYSKGIDKRLNALDRLWTQRPDLTHTISLLQIAIPSRSGIKAYSDLQKNVARLICDINSRYREGDWTPISYVEEGFSQAELASLYRAAKVALVTPLRDGMNLVAKEYVAAQDPTDPGVLILSKFAGAAKELDQALLVDPNNIDDIADKIEAAISMSPCERHRRWRDMIGRLRAYPIQRWTAHFIAELEKIRAEKLVEPFSAQDAGEPSGSKEKTEGKLAGGTSQDDLPRQLSYLPFDLRARRLNHDFTHIVGSDWNHGPQPAPDVLLGVLNRFDAFPRSFQPTTVFYIHGHPYIAQLAAGIREVTPNNPLGVNVILIPRLKGG